ncbi:hypothetical protein GWI33_002279 [Rhynchophorus ferrugineus]|uniref:DUF7041 domain-containing protein n=1 Tax=Rhynchophorus ferrugineus TaxID=354439 RepID=A0A834HLI6_RHYFE|nr:hypothetical protein GWI33_002279 [Rhynchophorus ferrugineus]
MSASNIRLPAFNPNDPEMWFLQVEWTLKHAGITTSAEKFEIVRAALDPIYTQEVRGLLFNPPSEAEDPFSKLKEALRECLGLSIQNRTRQLLEREEIGDRTPSQFLRRLQSLAGDAAGHDIIKVIWRNQLDPITRASIAAQQASIKLEDLDTATHVFVRHDSPKTPLQMPYDGPYEVISRSEKVFILLMRGKQVPVSMDRLKPAYCINDNLRPRESDLDDDGIVVVATQQNPDPHSPHN